MGYRKGFGYHTLQDDGDEITNMLIGLKEIHSSRCMKLWDIFEDMAHNKCFKHPEEELLGFATDKEAGFEATKMPMEAPFILEDEGKSDDDLMGDKNWRDYVTENLEQPETKGTIKEQPSSDDPLKVAVNAMDDQENIRNIKLWNNIRKEMETGSSKKN